VSAPKAAPPKATPPKAAPPRATPTPPKAAPPKTTSTPPKAAPPKTTPTTSSAPQATPSTKLTPCQAALYSLYTSKQPFPKITVPKPPAPKAKERRRRSRNADDDAGKDHVRKWVLRQVESENDQDDEGYYSDEEKREVDKDDYDEPTNGTSLSKRTNFEVNMWESKAGQPTDSLWTQGLGTCTGVAVTFAGNPPAKTPNKVMAHIVATNMQTQFDKLGNQVYGALSLWKAANAEPASVTFSVSLSNINNQVADMVASMPGANEAILRGALQDVENEVITAVQGIAANTSPVGTVRQATRAPGMAGPPMGMLTIQENNAIVHEGQSW
jgi:hypothetical protein